MLDLNLNLNLDLNLDLDLDLDSSIVFSQKTEILTTIKNKKDMTSSFINMQTHTG